MQTGPIAPTGVPEQNAQLAMLLAERWIRASRAQEEWAETAKKCVDFIEGRQWTEDQKAKLENEGRPALTFNKIAPLYRLILGYHRNNRMDVSFPPANDENSTEQVSELLDALYKQFSEASGMPWVDAEVFADGLSTGRGFLDMRLSFEDNDFGEIVGQAVDPFSVYIDPDADDYDLSKGASYVMVSRWASIEEIEHYYGQQAAGMIGSIVKGDGFTEHPNSFFYASEETTPVRKFGNETGSVLDFWHTFQEQWVDFIDPSKKNIRVVDAQSKVTKIVPHFVDLETGQREVIPSTWDKQKIEKALWHAERIGNPMRVVNRPHKMVRWTVMVGDIVVFDKWSPYKDFTLIGYFPYFRRGQTRGMIDDLIDPQTEINKRRSAEIEIVGRTTNSGWLHHEQALDPDQEDMLDKFGSSPGIRIKWKGQPNMKPERINPTPPPMAMERLEDKARDDLRQISGINESALGELDRVQSGRAIEARQRQAVLAFQLYLDNFSRTAELKGQKFLRLVQDHYTEERMIRIKGEDGNFVTRYINQRKEMEPGIFDVINNITLGKYIVNVDETPMAKTFQNAQFEEAMAIIERIGPILGPAMATTADLVVDMSSMPRKQEWKERLQMAMGIAQSDPGAGGGVNEPMTALGNGTLSNSQSLTGNVVPMPDLKMPSGGGM